MLQRSLIVDRSDTPHVGVPPLAAPILESPVSPDSLLHRQLPAALAPGGTWETLGARAQDLHRQGRYDLAVSAASEALALAEQADWHDRSFIARSLNDLAALHTTCGRYELAEPLYVRALALREESLGAQHPEVAQSFNNLAHLRATLGQYTAAEWLYERALSIQEKILDPEHPDLASTLNNLAVLLKTQGKLAPAGALYRRALAIREKVCGPESPEVALSLHTLAALLAAEGNPAAAEPLCRRSLSIREKAFGPDHSDVAMSLNVLAMLCASQGRPAEAETHHARALAIRERVMVRITPMWRKACTTSPRCSWPKAGMQRPSICSTAHCPSAKTRLGRDHPLVAATLEALAKLRRQTGRQDEAGRSGKAGVQHRAMQPLRPQVPHRAASQRGTSAPSNQLRARRGPEGPSAGPTSPHSACTATAMATTRAERGSDLSRFHTRRVQKLDSARVAISPIQRGMCSKTAIESFHAVWHSGC